MRRICQVSMMALAALGIAGTARAADAPIPVMQGAPGAQIPNGWVWQGVWQDGRWSGQWVPGPGVAPGMMPPANMMPPGQPPMAPPAMDCGKHHHEAHECGAMPPPMPYGPAGYGPMMGPMMMGWTWVPVQTQPQQPCVETRTTTVTYEYDRRPHHPPRPRPHPHDKRVYTGS